MYEGQAAKSAYPQTATQVRETPRLMQQCEQMHKMLASVNEQARRLDEATNRLIAPRPQAVEKSGPDAPPPTTVEQHYAMMIGVAERINLRLSEIASHLESAV